MLWRKQSLARLAAYKHTRGVEGRHLLADCQNMSSAFSVVVLLSVLALVVAGGYESEGQGNFGGFGGQSGGEESGGFEGAGEGLGHGGEGLDGGAGGAGHHDLKGYAFSYVNVHKPKTFTVPVYKYVLHDEHHGGQEQAGGEQGAAGGDFGGHEAFGGGQEDFGHHY